MLLCSVNKTNHVTILLVASTLAMIGLVFFQYKWISHSRKLSEEIFNQRASMALCSTLEEYGGGASCNPGTCGDGNASSNLLPQNLQASNGRQEILENEAFREDLRKTLNFYNIDLNYQISQSTCRPEANAKNAAPMCVVNIPPHIDQPEAFVMLAFPGKEKFMAGKLKYMIGASVLILLFTAIVLWLANWWLMKQKKLLNTNAEIYNSMAHEFRTPLTNIQLAASLLSKDPASSGNAKLLDIITRENSRLIQQVERVLHLARIDNGDYALKNERLHVKALLSSVIDEMQMQIEEKNAHVSIAQISDGFEIYGDRQHLTNAFRNLIDNSLKYTVEQPEISITAEEDKEGILISFQDNGIGIPASRSRQIFDKFHRIQDGQLNEQKGFGLGLAYVKRIVELHKGFIQLDCGISHGSRFNVFLPKIS
jgi:two-component sensor histidine kinase